MQGNPKIMRFLGAVAAVVLLATLGYQQILSDVLVRRAARPASFIGSLPERFDRHHWFTPTQRLLVARKALAENDLPATRRALQRLAPNSDRDSLKGELAERENDMHAALSAYFAAGDVVGLARVTTHMQASGDIQGALALQELIVGRIEEETTQPEALADAWLRLGQLYDVMGWSKPGKRAAYARRAMDAYERAVALAPYSQTYLLNAGYEALYLGNFKRSEALFSRACETDPKSTDARAGLETVRAAARKASR
jgi:tetratricopeptide (TPR) repeat protein